MNRSKAVPSCANPKLLRTELRERLGWTENHIVSDCSALRNEYEAQHWAPSVEDAAAASMDATTDLECDGDSGVVYAAAVLQRTVAAGAISEQQLDAALTRVFRGRLRLGLFDVPAGRNPYDQLRPATSTDTPTHRALAERMAQESLVLLKNDQATLPLRSGVKADRLCVFGPAANISTFGNYAPQNMPQMTTYLQGLEDRHGQPLTYLNGCIDGNGTAGCILECPMLDTRVATLATRCDVIVLVLGTTGDKGTACGCHPHGFGYEAEGCDRARVALPGENLARAVVSARRPPGSRVVLVVNNAGMVELEWAKQSPDINAILHGAYPGQASGIAVAATLFGDVSPAGRLALTYYHDLPQSLPNIHDYTNMVNRTYRYTTAEVPVTYPFGYGLTYTTFVYSNATIDQFSILACGTVVVTVTVSNTGTVSSDEVTQLYVSTHGASVPLPPRPELRGFTRSRDIEPGTDRKLSFQLGPRALSVLAEGTYIPTVEPGVRTVFIGSGQPHAFAGVQRLQFSVTGPAQRCVV